MFKNGVPLVLSTLADKIKSNGECLRDVRPPHYLNEFG
jgi:hypothetical protein